MAQSERSLPSSAGDDASLAAIDPLLVQAAQEVDPTLLDWSLRLSPRERLRACTNATRALDKFVRGSSSTR